MLQEGEVTQNVEISAHVIESNIVLIMRNISLQHGCLEFYL